MQTGQQAESLQTGKECEYEELRFRRSSPLACRVMGIECSSCYLVGYLSHWYLIGLFVVDLALILRHREDCSVVRPVECTVKLVMVNLGQQVLEVLSLGSNNNRR